MSNPIITRAEFQQLAKVRSKEAKALLDLGKWDGAYYLAGYAVELALKACIIKALMATDAFPEKRFYTHDLAELMGLTGLKAAWNAATAADPLLNDRWTVVRDWSEHKRYHRIAEAESRQLYEAISEPVQGVLPWIEIRW